MNEKMKLTPDGIDLRKFLRETELSLIIQAMEMAKGNCTYAAALLGITRTSLVEKRRRYQLKMGKVKKQASGRHSRETNQV